MHRLWFFCLLMLAACGPRESAQAPATGSVESVAPSAPALANDAAVEHGAPVGAVVLRAQAHDDHSSQERTEAGLVSASAPSDLTRNDPCYQKAIREAMQAQRTAVVRATQQGGPASVLSPMAAPTPFDREAWEADPWPTALAYAQISEPARSRVVGRQSDPVLVRLPEREVGPQVVVQGPPFAPIAASTPDRIVFTNGLCHITRVADSRGIAVFELTVPDGTFGSSHIHISSPVACGSLEVVDSH